MAPNLHTQVSVYRHLDDECMICCSVEIKLFPCSAFRDIQCSVLRNGCKLDTYFLL